jgi:CxxC motif-containing protein (DUF1111 family)
MVGGMQLWAAGGAVLGLALAAACNANIKVLDAADRDGPMRAGAGAAAAGSGAAQPADVAAAGGSASRVGDRVPAAGSGANGLPRAPRPDADGCIPPRFDALFTAGDVKPIVERRADGVIVTRGAGRVRGRHELEGTYSPYGGLYFEHRSYAFTIVDRVAAGGDTIEFTYEPEAPVSDNGPTTNFRHWKIYGDGNVFHSNVSMAGNSPRKLEYTVERNARDDRAMRAGDVLEFEFGIFISGNADGDHDPIEGRNSYYTDTFRYRVGMGGLSADNADSSGTLGPDDHARLGGDTTIPWIYAEPELYFSQMALNMQPEHVQGFLRGRRLFHTDFENGAHSEGGNPSWTEQAGKLGPLFDAHACVGCHERDGRGRPPAPGAAVEELAVKLYAPARLGNQLQRQEGLAMLEGYDEHEVELADGTKVPLRKPRFVLEGAPKSELAPSIRIARQIPGAGLLEAIDEGAIVMRADPNDCDGDGISGRAQSVSDPRALDRTRLGRFGWKAEKISVEHQVADALDADMGVSSPVLPERDGEHELSEKALADLVTYTRLLGLPAQRNANDPRVKQGEQLFSQVGCVRCHAGETKTGDAHPFVELRAQTIRPYSDLLLHDMGKDLEDGSGTTQASEWRTPPLWGLGLIQTVSGEVALLHDGRARSPLEAVLWHGGEAAFARTGVIGLDKENREALLTFLDSL